MARVLARLAHYSLPLLAIKKSAPDLRLRRYSVSAGPVRQRHFWLLLSTLALLASVKTLADEATGNTALRIGTGNALAGKQKSEAMRCQECHGVDGNSNDERIPNHAGQYAAYLIKQLHDFQSGKRKHDTMTLMAEDLTEADIVDIAAYFSGQKAMSGEVGSAPAFAKQLFAQGDPARDIPGCISCHGEQGKGRLTAQAVYPVLAGQRRVYLRSQLVNWQLRDRTNSPADVMNKIAKALTADEIDALVNYIAGLSGG
ncbi:MAG: c-type cytochrome [Methylococcales bacterium]